MSRSLSALLLLTALTVGFAWRATADPIVQPPLGQGATVYGVFADSSDGGSAGDFDTAVTYTIIEMVRFDGEYPEPLVPLSGDPFPANGTELGQSITFPDPDGGSARTFTFGLAPDSEFFLIGFADVDDSVGEDHLFLSINGGDAGAPPPWPEFQLNQHDDLILGIQAYASRFEGVSVGNLDATEFWSLFEAPASEDDLRSYVLDELSFDTGSGTGSPIHNLAGLRLSAEADGSLDLFGHVVEIEELTGSPIVAVTGLIDPITNQVQVGVVPEPGTFALMGASLLVGGVVVRRRRKRAA